MAAPDKDTIYVDIDDEITTIIDKIHSSAGRIVALVLPKRATVFQSIVNMKLVKRAADTARKRIVLVTSEANLMPLASAVGLHVAATPQSRPEIPAAAEPITTDDETVDEAEPAFTADNAGHHSIGELAKRSGHVVMPATTDETVSLDDEEDGETDVAEPPKKVKRDHSLSVPNFNAFRLRLFLGVLLLIALIVGYYVATVILPKAAIAIKTNTSAQNVNMTIALDTAAQKLDTDKLIAPAKSEQQQKTTSQQVDATGQKNTGAAATGSITMTAAKCGGNPFTKLPSVPAGVGVSTNGLTFITQEATSFTTSGAYLDSNGCYNYPATAATAIAAQSGGTKYNVKNAKFTVTGVTTADQNATSVSATGVGSADGGTDNIIKIIAQADIDSAKQKLAAQDTDAVKATLQQALTQEGLYPIVATFKAGDPIVTSSANAGDTANTVTVTQAVTYTMLGAKQADLDTLITKTISAQIDPKTQSILNDGLSQATITLGDTAGTVTHVSMQTVATVGPDINPTDIKKQARGKKIGDVKAMLSAIPGVTDVQVNLSPLWVSTVPNDVSKVTVTVDKVQ